MEQFSRQSQPTLSLIQFNEISEPGAYVDQQGRLWRVQKDALKEQHSPLITVASTLDTRATRIDSDPFVPIGKARQLAADADLAVCF
ncbi:MAG: hypothetical protein WAP55_02920 [Minisyncoccia bacterium]